MQITFRQFAFIKAAIFEFFAEVLQLPSLPHFFLQRNVDLWFITPYNWCQKRYSHSSPPSLRSHRESKLNGRKYLDVLKGDEQVPTWLLNIFVRVPTK
jgi:hypothetical protein